MTKKQNEPADLTESSGENSIPVEAGGSLKSAAEIAAERAAAAGASFSNLENELEQLRASLAKAQDNHLRTQADLDNYRKRVVRERQELIRSANEKLIQDLLAPIDHFEMGLQAASTVPESDPFRQGMQMILAQFQQFLKNHNVTEIDAAGQSFDPAIHEAVAHQESPLPEGQVLQQLRKGYRLNEKLLRPATVVVSKGPPSGESTATE